MDLAEKDSSISWEMNLDTLNGLIFLVPETTIGNFHHTYNIASIMHVDSTILQTIIFCDTSFWTIGIEPCIILNLVINGSTLRNGFLSNTNPTKLSLLNVAISSGSSISILPNLIPITESELNGLESTKSHWTRIHPTLVDTIALTLRVNFIQFLKDGVVDAIMYKCTFLVELVSFWRLIVNKKRCFESACDRGKNVVRVGIWCAQDVHWRFCMFGTLGVVPATGVLIPFA